MPVQELLGNVTRASGFDCIACDSSYIVCIFCWSQNALKSLDKLFVQIKGLFNESLPKFLTEHATYAGDDVPVRWAAIDRLNMPYQHNLEYLKEHLAAVLITNPEARYSMYMIVVQPVWIYNVMWTDLCRLCKDHFTSGTLASCLYRLPLNNCN